MNMSLTLFHFGICAMTSKNNLCHASLVGGVVVGSPLRKRLCSFGPKKFDRSSRFTVKDVPVIQGQFNITKSQKNLGPQHMGH